MGEYGALPWSLRIAAGLALTLLTAAASGVGGGLAMTLGAVVLLASPWLAVFWLAARAARDRRTVDAALAVALVLLAAVSLLLVV